MTLQIRVVLPAHLRALARIANNDEVTIEIEGEASVSAIIDSLEHLYPMLCGTLRERRTNRRRSLVRFFACEQDITHDSPDSPLPEAIARGVEPLIIIGAIAGG